MGSLWLSCAVNGLWEQCHLERLVEEDHMQEPCSGAYVQTEKPGG